MDFARKLTFVSVISWLMMQMQIFNQVLQLLLLYNKQKRRLGSMLTLMSQRSLKRPKALALLSSLVMAKNIRWRRQYLIRPGRTSFLWENFINNIVVPDEWGENFRMLRRCFFHLYEQLRSDLENQSTNMRCSTSTEKQVAITLYYLSYEGRYRKISIPFGISRAAVSCWCSADQSIYA